MCVRPRTQIQVVPAYTSFVLLSVKLNVQRITVDAPQTHGDPSLELNPSTIGHYSARSPTVEPNISGGPALVNAFPNPIYCPPGLSTDQFTPLEAQSERKLPLQIDFDLCSHPKPHHPICLHPCVSSYRQTQHRLHLLF